MVFSRFSGIKIKAISTVVGNKIQKIDDLLNLYDDKDSLNKVKSKIGLNQVHIVDKNTTSLDLCLEATQYMLNHIEIKANDIDTVIFVTQTPDYILPGNSSIIHKELELDDNCSCIDLSQGCSGYIYGLWLSYMIIHSSNCNNILLLAGDTMSKNLKSDDKSTRPLFGDSGTSTLIQRDDCFGDSFFNTYSSGQGFDSIIIEGGGSRYPFEAKQDKSDNNNKSLNSNFYLTMMGTKVFNFAIDKVPKAIQEIKKFANLKEDDIDYYFFHQANKYVLEKLCKKMNIDISKAPNGIVERYGNQGPSSIPSAISYSLANERFAHKKVQTILCGFGVGLSWGAAAIELNDVLCLPIIISGESTIG